MRFVLVLAWSCWPAATAHKATPDAPVTGDAPVDAPPIVAVDMMIDANP